MADKDDKVLLQDDTQEETTAVDTLEQALQEGGPTDEELAAAKSMQLVRGEQKETANSAMDAIDKRGDFMTGVLTEEHREATRDKVTGAMKLDFLGGDDEEEAPEMPSSLPEEIEETPEPANDESVNTGWSLPSREEAVQYAADGASLAYVGASMLSPVDVKQVTRMGAAAARMAAEKAEKTGWQPQALTDMTSKALHATADVAKEGVSLAETAEKRVDDIAERQVKKAA